MVLKGQPGLLSQPGLLGHPELSSKTLSQRSHKPVVQPLWLSRGREEEEEEQEEEGKEEMGEEGRVEEGEKDEGKAEILF